MMNKMKEDKNYGEDLKNKGVFFIVLFFYFIYFSLPFI